MTDKQALEYLTRDGGRIPCSPWGTSSEEAAPVALVLARIMDGEDAGRMGPDLLDEMMSLVVNAADDVPYLIANYGAEYGADEDMIAEARDLLGGDDER
jgi:hypothetical protein